MKTIQQASSQRKIQKTKHTKKRTANHDHINMDTFLASQQYEKLKLDKPAFSKLVYKFMGTMYANIRTTHRQGNLYISSGTHRKQLSFMANIEGETITLVVKTLPNPLASSVYAGHAAHFADYLGLALVIYSFVTGDKKLITSKWHSILTNVDAWLDPVGLSKDTTGKLRRFYSEIRHLETGVTGTIDRYIPRLELAKNNDPSMLVYANYYRDLTRDLSLESPLYLRFFAELDPYL